ncbi:MAG: efflux RND transporter periplasmic adaptor subunit [Gemmatimonadetes bacterium]|nr:efflux RND transporter periplasmic adaptor subunit [Gemmatimonadota bacterium]
MRHARPARFLLAALVLGACGKKDGDVKSTDSIPQDSSQSSSNLTLPVVGEEVRVGDLILTVSATGLVRTDASATIKAETGGTVEAVTVRAGDRVKKGQVLARLDPKPLDLAVQEAEARLRQAEITYNSEVVADSTVEGSVRPERRAYMRSKAGIDGALVGLEKAKLERERAVVLAPFDGMVERVSISLGERIGAGAEVAVVVDLMNLRVEAQVQEQDLAKLRVGGDAFITVAATSDKPIRGTIAAILPMVDSVTRAGKAVVRVRGDGMLRPGMYASLRLEANRLTNRTIVPQRAVIERDGRPLVFVVRDGVAMWEYIQRGESNGREMEVLPDTTSGLIPVKKGDIVLVDGHLTLTHQARVRLVAKREGDQN